MHVHGAPRLNSLLLFLLILVELGVVAFIFFDKSWKEEIPRDKTGDFDMISRFLEKNWKIAKWVALGAVIFETLVFLLALLVKAANKPEKYDSDEEYLHFCINSLEFLTSSHTTPGCIVVVSY
ncbi:hypothetical protein POM88_046985 [Heracleum sosnowskyi]|uniref:Uncharacterized protein n=1 Tax=Heracleum sosnowskyi TaxID=360622 RepID=A0AAD8H8U0_9APIA|nr:hypothetical protein POM88_046985 [Heracleum sosnowskyi]